MFFAPALRAVKRTAGLVPGIRAFLSERITVAQAESEIRAAMGRREEHFLEVVRAGVFDAPRSPYRPLFKWAGCEFADLEAGVRRDGLESTLEQLARNGVYLTSEEFKGKKPIIRGEHTMRVSPEDFLGLISPSAIAIASTGTMNQPIR